MGEEKVLMVCRTIFKLRYHFIKLATFRKGKKKRRREEKEADLCQSSISCVPTEKRELRFYTKKKGKKKKKGRINQAGIIDNLKRGEGGGGKRNEEAERLSSRNNSFYSIFAHYYLEKERREKILTF